MIYSEDFVWLHFPKCAGVKIENLFKTYYSRDERIFQDTVDSKADPLATWHDSIADREQRDSTFKLGRRTVICSFRRLPGWLESRYSFEAQRSPHLKHRPELLLEGKFLEQSGVQNHADAYVRKYIPDALLASDRLRFIRTEHFAADFKSAFAPYVDVSIVPDAEFAKRANASRSAVPAEIRRELLQNAKRLYEQCPRWKAVEELAYPRESREAGTTSAASRILGWVTGRRAVRPGADND